MKAVHPADVQKEKHMNILVPLDGSPLAERALETALALQQAFPAPTTLLLVRVAPYPYLQMALESQSPVSSAPMLLESEEEAAQAYFHDLLQQPRFAGRQIQTIVQRGDPSAVICQAAEDRDAHLIVMTTHGRSGIARTLMGSVASAVVRDSHIPVFLVRPTGATLPDPAREAPCTILVPLDGTELAEAVLPAALQLAQALKGTLALLRVVSDTPQADETRFEEAHAYLVAVRDRLQHHGGSVVIHVGRGVPAHQIVTHISELHADLLAFATHARAGLKRVLEGSITESVIQHVSLPVLVVHPQAIVASTRVNQ
jgi:nucleotide-binding universal stress UspA family protein